MDDIRMETERLAEDGLNNYCCEMCGFLWRVIIKCLIITFVYVKIIMIYQADHHCLHNIVVSFFYRGVAEVYMGIYIPLYNSEFFGRSGCYVAL